jgi:hypothetical protein
VTLSASKRPAPLRGSTALQQLALAIAGTVLVAVAGGVVARLIPQSGLWQAESVVKHLQAAIMFGAASLGLLSGRWIARTSVGFACAALLVLAFAGAVSGAAGQTGFAPVFSTGGAALAVILLLAAAAAPEVQDAESLRRLVARESGPTALLALVALTPVIDALLVAAMEMPSGSRSPLWSRPVVLSRAPWCSGSIDQGLSGCLQCWRSSLRRQSSGPFTDSGLGPS